MLCDNWK